jgi:hypothetical protein
MKRTFLAMGVAVLVLAACDNAENADNAEETTPAVGETSGDRARESLEQAGEAAQESLRNLGEAGRAGVDALQENAPAIREGMENAGERLRNAAGALIEDPDRPDMPGDSELDADETPEALEPSPPQQ